MSACLIHGRTVLGHPPALAASHYFFLVRSIYAAAILDVGWINVTTTDAVVGDDDDQDFLRHLGPEPADPTWMETFGP
ncbi:MAG: hypothetical protein ACREYC_10745 [Gammaproteobacteria bacterium]